jgi:hypothetical protein
MKMKRRMTRDIRGHSMLYSILSRHRDMTLIKYSEKSKTLLSKH